MVILIFIVVVGRSNSYLLLLFFATRDGTYILYIILCPQYLICVPDQERVFHILVRLIL